MSQPADMDCIDSYLVECSKYHSKPGACLNTYHCHAKRVQIFPVMQIVWTFEFA